MEDTQEYTEGFFLLNTERPIKTRAQQTTGGILVYLSLCIFANHKYRICYCFLSCIIFNAFRVNIFLFQTYSLKTCLHKKWIILTPIISIGVVFLLCPYSYPILLFLQFYWGIADVQ